MRQFLRMMMLTAAAAGAGIPFAQAQSVISQSTAARYGLSRAWYAQVGSPRSGGTLEHVEYDEGLLLVQSSRGMLTAIDGETGRTLWATQIGPRDRMTSEPAANEKYVVVLNGSTLYVVNRARGDIAWQRLVQGAPGAGPGVTSTHAFVPIITGLVEGYDLELGPDQSPWIYQSSGRILTPPMTTLSTVSWTTDRGHFYVADPSGGGIRYRLETRGEIHARPGSWSPRLFAGSTDGYVYAMNEQDGRVTWEFPAGDAIYQPPVAIGERVFIVTQLGGMYCLDAKQGEPLWRAPNVRQFVAVSPSRVYVADSTAGLSVLDVRGGARLGTMPLDGVTTRVVNSRSDRIFLVNDSNVIQCLRETHLRSPVVYTPPPPPKKREVKLKQREAEVSDDAPVDSVEESSSAEPESADPFETEMPAEDDDEVENPFDVSP